MSEVTGTFESLQGAEEKKEIKNFLDINGLWVNTSLALILVMVFIILILCCIVTHKLFNK